MLFKNTQNKVVVVQVTFAFIELFLLILGFGFVIGQLMLCVDTFLCVYELFQTDRMSVSCDILYISC
jgi:hypothetical protein